MPRYRGLTLRVLGARAPAMGPGKAELIERIAIGLRPRAAWKARGISGRFCEIATGASLGGSVRTPHRS